MVLRAVLSAQAGKVSQALGMRSGVEMRAARSAAERIGAQVVLGGLPYQHAHLAWETTADNLKACTDTVLQAPAAYSNVEV